MDGTTFTRRDAIDHALRCDPDAWIDDLAVDAEFQAQRDPHGNWHLRGRWPGDRLIWPDEATEALHLPALIRMGDLAYRADRAGRDWQADAIRENLAALERAVMVPWPAGMEAQGTIEYGEIRVRNRQRESVTPLEFVALVLRCSPAWAEYAMGRALGMVPDDEPPPDEPMQDPPPADRAPGDEQQAGGEPGDSEGEAVDGNTINVPACAVHPDPVDLWGTFNPPALPLGLLPREIEDFARVQGTMMGADEGGLALAALATCAAAITDPIQVQVKRYDTSWRESARIWVALVGSPSTKKTPILSAASGPLCRLDMQMFRDWQQELNAFLSLPKEEQKGKRSPPQRRLRIEDATVEAAQQVLEGSTGGVMLLQDEMSGWFGAMEKYSGGKGAAADRAFWLRSFNGGEYALNRVARGAALIPNLSVCMLGGIQPDPIRRIAADAADDGLLQRLFPIVLRPATLGHDLPAPDVVGEYADLVERLHQLRPPGFAGSGVLTFTDEAQKIRRDLEERHLSLQGSEAVSRKLAAHIGKYDGMFARLCVIWHCIENRHAPDLPGEITADVARRVGEFLHRFLLPHAVAFYGGILGLSPDHDDLQALAGFILAHGKQVVTNRDVQRGIRTMRKIQERDLRAILEQLEALGWVTRYAGPRPSSPPVWIVNPVVHRRFADRTEAERQRRAEARQAITDLLGGGHA